MIFFNVVTDSISFSMISFTHVLGMIEVLKRTRGSEISLSTDQKFNPKPTAKIAIARVKLGI